MTGGNTSHYTTADTLVAFRATYAYPSLAPHSARINHHGGEGGEAPTLTEWHPLSPAVHWQAIAPAVGPRPSHHHAQEHELTNRLTEEFFSRSADFEHLWSSGYDVSPTR